MKIYGIFDIAIGAYTGAPFFQPTNAAAVRMIAGEVNRGENMLAQHPQDFELWELGTFNEQDGSIEPKRERVMRLSDIAAKREEVQK